MHFLASRFKRYLLFLNVISYTTY